MCNLVISLESTDTNREKVLVSLVCDRERNLCGDWVFGGCGRGTDRLPVTAAVCHVMPNYTLDSDFRLQWRYSE
jgi:hypothetical protein